MTYKKLNIIFITGLVFLALADVFLFKVSVFVYLAGVAVYTGITIYGSAVVSSQLFLPAICKGKSDHAVAITFDDGPVPGKTNRILDILAEHQVPATFFCIGNRIYDHPDLVRQLLMHGHAIGNHSYWHGTFFDLQSAGKIRQELQMTDEAIEQVIGKRPVFFRPPYGVTNPALARAVKQGNYITIGWSIRSMDTVIKNPEVLLNKVTKSVKGGDIILLHDHSEATIVMLPKLLAHLVKSGLKIVPLDVLVKKQAYA